MGNSLMQHGSKLVLGLLFCGAVAGCGHHRHHREAAVAAYDVEPVYIDGVAVIDDPDPFIVERERFYLAHPGDIRIVGDVVYFRGERIHNAREARAIRLAVQAHRYARERETPHARRVHGERIEAHRAPQHIANREAHYSAPYQRAR